MNGAQIASIVVTANQVDIDAGQLAASRATNDEVKDESSWIAAIGIAVGEDDGARRQTTRHRHGRGRNLPEVRARRRDPQGESRPVPLPTGPPRIVLGSRRPRTRRVQPSGRLRAAFQLTIGCRFALTLTTPGASTLSATDVPITPGR